MKTEVEIRVPPSYLDNKEFCLGAISQKLKISSSRITHFSLIRRSLDARRKPVVYLLRYLVFVDQPVELKSNFSFVLKDVSKSEPVIIVGFGPAGMFAALRLIELGIKPIVLERGKAVRERRRDIAEITKRGNVNPNSNYCFGEGGAGTFSDGKLYTRSDKRGSVQKILNILVANGADPEILVDAHPHIGTNKLPQLVQSIREAIVAHGGEVYFDSTVSEIILNGRILSGVKLKNGYFFCASAVVLAGGHSARDIFQILFDNDILLESKPFSLGLRVEHPQQLIDRIQYGADIRGANLPAATYSLVSQCEGRGVFSFCMCPGGIICPAATENNQIVVNGWSPSKRNSYFANSGIVVEVKEEDFLETGALAGMNFQKQLEEKAYLLGGGRQVAPAQRLTDFLSGRVSSSLPKSSYLPGLRSSDLSELFPQAFYGRLQQAFKSYGKKLKDYITDEAVVLAPESRTSSPVRIPRDSDSCMHPQIEGLFPAGEGAGYAGGIMSAAMDGDKVATAVCRFIRE